VNLFVGGFIGSPAMNMLEGTIERRSGGIALSLGSQTLGLGEAAPALKGYEGRRLVVGIRPEHLEEASLSHDAPADRRLRGNVELREALGSELIVHFSIDAPPAQTQEMREIVRDAGGDPEGGLKSPGALLVGRFGARAAVKEGEPVEVVVDTGSLHFFDPETGLGIYDQQQKGAT
jgi:multiple sugar transport system ATP-binding protein